MTLHVAMRLLTSEIFVQNNNYLNYAEQLLKHFVESFEILYGRNKMSHNVHNLLHLTEDVRKFGAVDQFSAFRFENYMSSIKRALRKSEKPLQQLFNRYSEMESLINADKSVTTCLRKQHKEGPLPFEGNENIWKQYKVCTFENFFIGSHDSRNNCFILKSGEIILIENILQNTDDNKIFIVGKRLSIVKDLYTLPCNSSDLEIYTVTLTDYQLHTWSIKQLDKKMWRMTYGSSYVVFPMLHF